MDLADIQCLPWMLDVGRWVLGVELWVLGVSLFEHHSVTQDAEDQILEGHRRAGLGVANTAAQAKGFEIAKESGHLFAILGHQTFRGGDFIDFACLAFGESQIAGNAWIQFDRVQHLDDVNVELGMPQQRKGFFAAARVNIPVGLLIWVMIIPMLLKIDFGAIGQVRQHMRGIGVTVAVNWLVKPFSMALLAWIFIRNVFAPYLPAEQLDSYIAGLFLLAAAPCTAMVFVWSQLSDGDPYFTLSQVALNDAIMIVAFAPIVGLLLGLSAITVPWDTLFISVALYIVIPVILAQLWRKTLLARGEDSFKATLAWIQPFSVAALLVTLVLLFAFQGGQILKQPLVIAMLAVPIVIQVYFNSGLAYLLNRKFGVAHCVAAPSALIGASNFFELAVAAAISLFGFNSGAALATVVGVLVEVPVMLSVVRIVNESSGWYERATMRAG
jgi:ACR3 family arsenite transporter